MRHVVDTSVLIDHLRGHAEAVRLLERLRARDDELHASEVTRLEVLAGMRPSEAAETEALLAVLEWHPLDDRVAAEAGALGRRWLPSHGGVDAADLAVAATATLLGTRPLTANVKHFPMFKGLERPY